MDRRRGIEGEVIVFGASGFLGRRLNEAFPERKTVGTYFQTPTDGLIYLDLRSPHAAVDLIKKIRPRLVIYAAGLTGVDACETHQDVARALNALAPAEIANSLRGGRMIYLSSDYVFDGNNAPYDEDAQPVPLSVYGRTKVEGERAVLKADPSNCVLRVSGLYSELGQNNHTFKMAQAKSEASDLLVSTPVHVDDVVAAVRLLAIRGDGGIYHAGGPHELSRYEFLQISALGVRGGDVFPTMDDGGGLRPRNSSLRSSRLEKLGWKARRVADALIPIRYVRLSAPGSVIPGPHGNRGIALDCVGAALAPRRANANDLIAEIAEQCGVVANEKLFWEQAVAKMGEGSVSGQSLSKLVAERYAPNPNIWRCIPFWRQTHRIALTNNGSVTVFRNWVDKYGFDRIFDTLVNSYEIGAAKPETRFFEIVKDKLGVEAGGLIVVDDIEENVLGARAVGFQGVQTHEVEISEAPLSGYDVDQRDLEDVGLECSGIRPSALTHSTDAFMFRQFSRHAQFVAGPRREQYFMLSAGTNLLPASDVWRDLAAKDYSTELAYGWYTDQRGFPLLQRTIAWHENARALGRLPKGEYPLGKDVAVTFGGSQAVAAVTAFAQQRRPGRPVLLTGLNYSLFERQAQASRMPVIECLGDNHASRLTPSAGKLANAVRRERPALLVMTVPGNPSGEIIDENDMVQIFSAAKESDAIILLDTVGQMTCEYASHIPSRAAIKAGVCSQLAIVNSMSKTESVPGCRFGYVIGSKTIIDHVAAYQLTDTMNPMTLPVYPVIFSLCARTLMSIGHENKDNVAQALSFMRRLFRITTAIPPQKAVDAADTIFSPAWFEVAFESYVRHHRYVQETIVQNEAYLHKRLGRHISAVSQRQAGLNFLVQFAPLAGWDEEYFTQSLLEQTGVAVLTEACFRREFRDRPNFWIRISLASPVGHFQSAVDRLDQWLEHSTGK